MSRQPNRLTPLTGAIKTTYDHYGHLFEGRDEAAADALEQARRRSRADQARTKREPKVVELRS